MSREDILSASVPERQGVSRRALPFLLIAGLGFLTTWGCFSAPPLNLDDGFLVISNPMVTGEWPWWECFRRIWFHQYVPLTFLSYRLNVALFGLDATWGFRLVNWLIHCSSAVVLWRLSSMLGWGRRGGFFVAILWVVHPLACETVAWISERSNALSFLFGSLGFWAYAKWHGHWRGVALGTLGLAAALLSKPFALGWFSVFVVFEVVGGSRRLAEFIGEPSATIGSTGMVTAGASLPDGKGRRVVQSLSRLFLPALLTSIFLLVGLGTYENVSRPPPGGTWFTACLSATDIFLRYVWNTLVPLNLSAMYTTYAISSPADPRLWLNLAIWAVLLSGSVALAHSRRRAVFGWLWFFGGLGPASNVIPIAYPMQDRFAYIASVGLLFVIVEVAQGVMVRARKREWFPESRLNAYGLSVSISYLCFLSLLTVMRAPLWADSLLLMEQAVELQPDGVLSHFHYAIQVEHRAKVFGDGPRKDVATAMELRRVAVEHLRTASVQRDSYIGGSIYMHVRLARDLSLLGNRGEAVKVLEDCQRNLNALSGERMAGRPPCVPTEPGCHPYVVRDTDITDMHICMGETYLAFAANDSGAEALSFYEKALQNARAAMQFKPMPRAKCELFAKIFLFREAFGDGSPAKAGVARGRLASVTLQFDEMARDRQILPLMGSPESVPRVQALACIAMARAGLAAVRQGGSVGVSGEGETILRSSMDWALRAISIDPKLGEGYWTLASAHALILDRIPPGLSAEAAKVKAERIQALSAIRPDSPRYDQAVAILKAERGY